AGCPETSGELGHKLGVGQAGAVLAMVAEHEARLDRDLQRADRLPAGAGTRLEAGGETGRLEQPAEERDLVLGTRAAHDPDPTPAAEGVLGPVPRTKRAGEGGPAHPRD